MSHVLIVDDEPAICWGLEKLCRKQGNTTAVASSAEEALQLSHRDDFDVVFLDVRLPGKSGLEILEALRQRSSFPRVIVMTAYGQLSTAVEAVRKGAFEYLVKPFSLAQVEQLLERVTLTSQDTSANQDETTDSLAANTKQRSESLVGTSPVMQEVFRQIALVSGSEACVHLYGESGTGKELVARAIHRYSLREKGPFVPVNLAALNPALAESELFGHVKGAFTGAEMTRKGVFDQAAGGTVFLDEVADIPASLQVKLLRALEEHEIWPVGADQSHHVDFRLISATNQNLLEAVRNGRFRHDLYYRLVTFQLELPPLRERKSDLPELARHFCRQVAPKRGEIHFSQEFLDALEKRPWHGNVRELRNAIEHALIISPVVSPAPWHLPAPMSPLQPGVTPDVPQSRTENSVLTTNRSFTSLPQAGEVESLTHAVRHWARSMTQEARAQNLRNPDAVLAPDGTGLHARFLETVEAELFSTVLEQCRQNMSEAARLLGIHRTTLKRKLEEYGLIADEN